MATYERLPPMRLNKAEVLYPNSFHLIVQASSLDSPQQSSQQTQHGSSHAARQRGFYTKLWNSGITWIVTETKAPGFFHPGLGRWTKRILINIPQPREQMTSHPLCSLCAALALAYLCLVVCSLQRPPDSGTICPSTLDRLLHWLGLMKTRLFSLPSVTQDITTVVGFNLDCYLLFYS